MAIASTFCRLNNLLWLGGDAPAKDDNGYCTTTPPYVRFWLVVIVDNTLAPNIPRQAALDPIRYA